MDYQTVLREITSWPADEQRRLVHEVSDLIGLDESLPELTDVQRAELDRRIADLDRNPSLGAPWHEAKARILAKLNP